MASVAPSPFRLRTGTKFQWELPRIKKLLDDTNRRSLKKAGRIVFGIARSSKVISSRAPKKKGDKRYRIGSSNGYSLYAVINKIPKADIVTSWKTNSFPKGFLRGSIQYDYSETSKTVVVGPGSTRGYNVASLQAYGGTAKYYFMPFARAGQARYSKRVYGRLTNTPMGTQPGVPDIGVFSFTRQIRGKSYMERAVGLAVASGKLPEQWKNQLRFGGGS